MLLSVIVCFSLIVGFSYWLAQADLKRQKIKQQKATKTASVKPVAKAVEKPLYVETEEFKKAQRFIDISSFKTHYVRRRNGQNILRYSYDFDFIADEKIKADNIDSKGLEVDLQPDSESDLVRVFLEDIEIGALKNCSKYQMICDWRNKNRFVCGGWVPRLDYLVMLFYQDYHAENQWREQTVTKLVSVRGISKQEALFWLEPHDVIDIDYNVSSGKTDVYASSCLIGSLPASIAKRCAEEDPFFIETDHVDFNDERNLYEPYIRIFW